MTVERTIEDYERLRADLDLGLTVEQMVRIDGRRFSSTRIKGREEVLLERYLNKLDAEGKAS